MSEYNWWQKALGMGGGRELSRDQVEALGVSENDPKSGFYRQRGSEKGNYVPVAIWRDGASLICLAGGKQVGTDRIEQVWTWCCRWPISEQVYRAVAAGEPWPDEPPAPKDHNQIKTGDNALDLETEFQAEAELAQSFLKKPVESQEQADKIAVWSKKVAGILSKANNEFKVEKQPWLNGGKAVDDRWRWRQDADGLVKALKRALDGWLRELDRREQERQRVEREKAEKIRREAEVAERRAREEAEKAAASGSVSDFAAEAEREAERLAQKAKDAEREAQARKINAGRTGANVSLRTFYDAKVTDYDALVMALKDEPEVREVITKIASRIARTQGATMPAGSERIEEKRAA